ncbi:hypothetical protein QQG55_39085 [Brugia pahangi]
MKPSNNLRSKPHSNATALTCKHQYYSLFYLEIVGSSTNEWLIAVSFSKGRSAPETKKPALSFLFFQDVAEPFGILEQEDY